MKTKHYIAIDTKETNEWGEKLLLPITPPYKDLRLLGELLGIPKRTLYRMVSGDAEDKGIAIEVVYLTREKRKGDFMRNYVLKIKVDDTWKYFRAYEIKENALHNFEIYKHLFDIVLFENDTIIKRYERAKE